VVRFTEQVVVVTGAGRGLGRAYASLIAALGGHVVVHDAGVAPDGTEPDNTVADAATSDIRATGGAAEASHEDLATRDGCVSLIDSTLERHGRIDALVHSAGLVLRAPLDRNDFAWRRSLAVNLEAAYWLCAAALPAMRMRRYGRIVLTTSGYGVGPADDVDDLVAYCVAKAGQVGLMNGLAFAVADGVLANAVAPVAATRVYSRAAARDELTPDQVAPGVAYLASSACSASGVILRAAGGRFSAGRFVTTDGVDLGREPASPDAVATRWPEIAG
jgi:NAD(P)-dependent dehydrogenase (short-subunit alcohol dehydrogenase family)